MLTAQIKECLKGFGYEMDEWFQPTNITMVIMDQDYNLQIDSSMMLRFSTDLECIELVYGAIIDGIFTSEDGKTSTKDFTPYNYFDFVNIAGMTSTVTYQYGRVFTRPFIQ